MDNIQLNELVPVSSKENRLEFVEGELTEDIIMIGQTSQVGYFLKSFYEIREWLITDPIVVQCEGVGVIWKHS